MLLSEIHMASSDLTVMVVIIRHSDSASVPQDVLELYELVFQA